MKDSEPEIRTALARLKWPLGLTWAGLFTERVTRAFWPIWTLLFLLIATLAFGLLDSAPLEAVWVVTVLWLLAFLWFLVSGVWRFRWPRRAEAMDRLDRTLPGRPLAALADHQAIGAGDAASELVWRAHVLRMAERAARARAARPDLRLAARDPYALRYVALTALVMAVLFGSIVRVSEISAIAPAPMRFDAQAAGTSWEAWIQPPAYTGRPSLYLNEVARPALSVPEGSRVTVRLYGESGVLTLAESISGRAEPIAEPAAPSHDFEIAQSGRLNVQGPGGRGWEITVQPDQPPSIRFADPMTRESGGALRQPFAATDDYGVVSGEAEIILNLDEVDRRFGLAPDPEPRDPIVLDLPMPISGNRNNFTEALIDNVSQHPWANLPVTIRLTATDARGQTGETAIREHLLPGRRFFDPMAAALIELRRDLLWSRESAPRVAQLLRAVSHIPDDAFRSERPYLSLRAALRQIEFEMAEGLSDVTRDEVAAVLWDIAVLIEDGDLADALERLQRAQEMLSEAMRSGADQSEIADLMQELRDAMQDYLRQLAEQSTGDDQEFAEGESMEITGDQLQELLDRIQELMEEGRMDEAMELMEQLNQMMENMRVTQGEGGGGSPGQNALEGLGQTLRDQQGLSDDTFRDLQERFGQERFGRPEGDGGNQGQGGAGDPDPEADGDPSSGQSLSDRQQALRDRMRQLDDMDLPGDGTAQGEETRQALDDAARAMERAEEALRNEDSAGALDQQAEAIEALREGMRGISEAMAEQQAEAGDGSTAMGDNGTDMLQDPLGRDLGQAGRVGSEENMLPDADVYSRAREILDEIRRRSGEQERPEVELDYLRRLLERF